MNGKIEMTQEELLHAGQVIDDFTIERMISVGGFGQVYSGFDRYNRKVAIKVEAENAVIPLLKLEAQCLQHVNQTHNPAGQGSKEPILQYYAFGAGHGVRYLVMEHSGCNLRELKKTTKHDQFSVPTSLWVMQKMIAALQFVHSLGWLHRDVKPANFCIGENDPRQIFLIDFGMCRYYLSSDGTQKPRKPFSAFHGTVRYASLNTHNRQDMSRWDDLWSVFYIAVENMVGALPWRFTSERDQVRDMKATCDLLQLKYGTESSAPACMVYLHRLLSNAYYAPESFYVVPNYAEILHRIKHDMSVRNADENLTLEWQPSEPNYQSLKGHGDWYQQPAAVVCHQPEGPPQKSIGEKSYYFF